MREVSEGLPFVLWSCRLEQWRTSLVDGNTHRSLLLQVRSAQRNDAVLPGTESKRHRLSMNQHRRQVQVSVWGQSTDLWVCSKVSKEGGKVIVSESHHSLLKEAGGERPFSLLAGVNSSVSSQE